MRPDEIGAGCALFHTVFGHARSPGEWRWKFAQTPALGTVNLVAVGANGHLVAHAGAQVFEGRWGERPLRWVHACDVMVHPEARGDLGPDNLYRRLMRGLDDVLQGVGPSAWPLYIYGFPGQRPARLGERMGLYRRLYRCEARQGGEVRRGPWQRWRATGGWRAQPAPWSALHDPHLVGFWHRASMPKEHSVGLVKSPAYLEWRYARHPVRRYRLWLLRRAWSPPQGWLVTAEAGSPVLIDAALPPGLPVRRVLDALAAASGIGHWRCWLPSELPSEPTPIVAVEFSGRGCFHPDWPLPRFQPGDTDVF